jgi:hypothetical protein
VQFGVWFLKEIDKINPGREEVFTEIIFRLRGDNQANQEI